MCVCGPLGQLFLASEFRSQPTCCSLTVRPTKDHNQTTRLDHTARPQLEHSETAARPQPYHNQSRDHNQTKDRPQSDHSQTTTRLQTDRSQTTARWDRQQQSDQPYPPHVSFEKMQHLVIGKWQLWECIKRVVYVCQVDLNCGVYEYSDGNLAINVLDDEHMYWEIKPS